MSIFIIIGLLGDFARLCEPSVPFVRVFRDPLFRVAFDVFLGFFAFIHAGVLLVDVRQGQREYFEKFLDGRILLDKFLVGDDTNIRNDKSELNRIADRSLDS